MRYWKSFCQHIQQSYCHFNFHKPCSLPVPTKVQYTTEIRIQTIYTTSDVPDKNTPTKSSLIIEKSQQLLMLPGSITPINRSTNNQRNPGYCLFPRAAFPLEDQDKSRSQVYYFRDTQKSSVRNINKSVMWITYGRPPSERRDRGDLQKQTNELTAV